MVNVLNKLRYNIEPCVFGVFCCCVVMAGSDKSVEYIHIENATENNLAHVCVDFPKYAFTVVTGLSGSGKSTLAFDTLYMESRRRYLDTLSMYARQFVGAIRRPTVERITGLSPSIAVVQGTAGNNPRSTVGTITEVYDFIRLLWGRAGVQVCPKCGIEVAATTQEDIVRRLMAWPERTKAILYAPIVQQRKGMHEDVLNRLRKSGFSHVRIDGNMCDLSEVGQLNKNIRHTIELVVDRVIIKPEAGSRISESVGTALMYGDGLCLVERLFEGAPSQMLIFSQKATCPRCGMSFPELSPDMLAFNKPTGACPDCHGVGVETIMRPEWMIGRPDVPLMSSSGDKVCGFLPLVGVEDDEVYEKIASMTKAACKKVKILPSSDWNSLTESQRTQFLDEICDRMIKVLEDGDWPAFSDHLSAFCDEIPCRGCEGSRLNIHARHVYFAGESLASIQTRTIDEAIEFFEHVTTGDLEVVAARIVEDLMPSLLERLRFVARVGLGYLQLARGASTLSGGEAQRVRLAGLLGNGLTAVTYILDEPSIGLHARDQARLIGVLKDLRDRGNTVVVVEHDDATMRACDYLIDIGPKAGRNGGNVIYAGPADKISNVTGSMTVDYLLGRRCIEVPASRRPTDKGWITIKNARQNNLKNIDVSIPLGCIVCVTGVSGSGKSSLINDLLLPNVRNYLAGRPIRLQYCDGIDGIDQIGRILDVDQRPIGRTPRSNPATYTKVFDLIRTLFAAIPDAKMYGYSASRFSFNVAASKQGGRCETCAGAGVRTIEMKFLSNTYVPCEDCHGKRFNEATLRVRYLGRNIADVLDMSFSEALELFAGQAKIEKILKAVCDVGLGYIKLGQPSPTLSGGEAQRMKLAREIAKTSKTKTVFIFDEPSTGLHADDVRQLIQVLERLADLGHTVIIIEHNLDMIKTADYVIDVGPEPGRDGGRIVGTGTPEMIASIPESHTGRYLRPLLGMQN